MGYHNKVINRGDFGEFSKIIEEFEELQDAHEQEDVILQMCEMSDLIGAIEAYAEKHLKVSLSDIIKFKEKTKSSFEEGKR